MQEALLDELDRKDIKTHIDQGSIHHHISDYAKDNNHDLIICGSHARHGLNLLLDPLPMASYIPPNAMC